MNKLLQDKALLAAIQAGDETATTKLYRLHRTTFVNWLVGTYQIEEKLAVDIFQEAVLIFYENAIGGKIQLKSSLKTYLFAIGKRRLYKHFEKERKYAHWQENSLEEIDLTDLVEEEKTSVSSNVQQRQLAKLLQKLGEPCKTILELFYGYEWNYADIALRLGYKSSHVAKTQKMRCMKQIRKTMNHDS